MKLETRIEDLNRVGKTTAKRLNKLGLETARDLIFHFPFRYEDFSKILPISKLEAGIAATIRGKIELIANRRSPRKRKFLTESVVSDKTGSVKVIWFNQPYLTKVLKTGDEVFLSGKVNFDRYDIQLINPIYEKAGKLETIHTARLVPIYSTTEKLTQKQIRFLIKSVIALSKDIPDWLPDDIKKRLKLLSLDQALKQIHFPKNYEQIDQALQRLKFDELLLFLLQVLFSKRDLKESKATGIKFFEKETKKFVESLPFKLTSDQRKASWEILQDLQKEKPMNRLLEGEVGSGKTIVVAIAILNTVLSGMQAVFMAPTEILASQHFETLSSIFNKLEIEIGLLTRTNRQITSAHRRRLAEAGNDKSSTYSGSAADRQTTTKSKILGMIKRGELQIIVGTHTLIQEDINFKDLNLIVVDEQHRFGVEQRKTIKEKSGNIDTTPHFLSMTATPIPRTLALSLYGDLDLSIIKQLPKERKKVITQITPPAERSEAYNFIEEKIKEGRQAFVICPLIDPSDKLGVKAVTEEFEKLSQEIFPQLKIGLLHGKLKTVDKEEVMKKFLANEINILVSTSVVEVGVDVPNAAVMMIEGAERFGLSQLHQFRGRVGRSKHQSYCLLFTESNSQKTKNRLQALVDCNDGFELAEKDLEFRGPGQIYGTEQSGFIQNLKLASFGDYELIKLAKREAENLLKASPNLEKYPSLKEKVRQLQKKIHWE